MKKIESYLSPSQKIVVIAFLIMACCSLTIYYHHILHSGRVVTHFFYIPIILSALWWRLRGVSVAIFLGLFLIFSGYWFKEDDLHINNYFRACIFISIAIIVGLLSERIHLAQKKLQEKEEKLQQLAAIVSSSNDAILSVDLGGRIISWNRAAEKIYGFTAEEILGEPVFRLIPEENHNDTRRILEMIAAQKDVETFESVRLRKDGSQFEALVTMSPIRNAWDQIIASSIIIHDISKRKEMENKLLIASQHLEQQVRIRTRQLSIANRELLNEINRRTLVEKDLRKSNDQIKLFSYRILHDLKSPSVSIHGLASLLNKKYGEALGEKGRVICMHILEGADQIAALVDKVNQFISTRELSIQIETVQVKELFAIVRQEFHSRLQERRISMTMDDTGEEIGCDRLALLRALRNLVENAVKYGGESLANICLGFSIENDMAVFSVKDDGRGIEHDNQQRIFDLFHRDRHSSVVDGTGLGLTIVKEVAEQHGGSVWLESAPGQGTTFYFSVSTKLSPQNGQNCA